MVTSICSGNLVRSAARLLLGLAGIAAASAGPVSNAGPGVPAAPAGWQRVGETAGTTVYVQPGSLQREGQIRRLLEMQNLRERDADGVLSRRYTAEYECRHRMVRIGRISSHAGPMLDGPRLFDVQEMGYWRKIVPGSPFALLHSIVCADYEGPRS